MKLFRAAVVGIGLFILGGCAVYDPYPVYQSYPSYPAYPPPVVVQPRIYGSWGYWESRPRYGHRHYGRGHGHGHGGHGRGHGRGGGRHWR